MHAHHRLLVCICAIALALGCQQNSPVVEHPTTAPSAYAEADEIKPALTFLASDELEGRGLQTEGINRAADFLAQHYKQDGLQTAPTLDGYFQEFQITVATNVGKKTSLTVKDKPLTVGQDFSPLGLTAEKSFAGPVAFVGYAITNPEKSYDDFAGIDAKGKIALAIRYEPTDDSGNSKFAEKGYSDHATVSTKARNAADHGAIALLIVNLAKGEDRLMTLNSSGGGEKAPIPVIHLSRASAASLLQQAGSDSLDKLQSQINTNLKPRSFDLANTQISGNVQIERVRKTFKNVVACLPGSGWHKDQYIVVGAHYDHLGHGELGSLARNSKQIHHGADDNGSGTVAVMELAEQMAKHGPLDRSILFINFVGEERGLLGSANFVAHPPVPLDKIVAMVNLDMVGRVKNDVILVGGNGTAADFDKIIKAADARSPLIVKNAGTDVGGRGGIGPSDHASFAMKKIPVIFLWSGMHRDYHRPTDTVDKINFVGIANVVDFCEELLKGLSKMPREQYVDKFDHSNSQGMGGIKVRLGIMPDYSAEDVAGVRIAGTMPDAPAAKAGLREGDVIIRIDTNKIESLGDYMTVLGKYKPGDVIKIVVERDKQQVELSATLAEPKG